MTEKETCCIKHLNERNKIYSEISTICNCSIGTVGRIAKKHNLSVGQGVKNFWEFNSVTTEFCYLFGAYLTEGTTNKTKFVFPNTNERMSDLVMECLIAIGAPAKKKVLSAEYVQKHSKKAKKQQYIITSYCSLLSNFLITESRSKDIIPQFIMNSNLPCKLALIAAIIDGDGSVTKAGSILVRGVHGFLFDLKAMLDELGVKTNNLRVAEILPSGKEYRALSIKRSDFVDIGGYCIIKRKMQRILYAKETRVRKKRVPKKYICPVCGLKVKSEKAKMCQPCHFKSDALIERLRSQSKRANIAANIARWG